MDIKEGILFIYCYRFSDCCFNYYSF